MNARNPYQNRRSNSQVLPRLYLFLQLVIIMLSSYMAYYVLSMLGAPQIYIILAIGLVDLYYLQSTFIKCREISKRGSFAKKFNY